MQTKQFHAPAIWVFLPAARATRRGARPGVVALALRAVVMGLLVALVIPGSVAASSGAAAAVVGEPPAGSVRYVSPSGNPNADGLTPQTPWDKLSTAMSRMQPGQTLRVLPGVYQETNSRGELRIEPALASGTPSQRITVQATSSNVEIRSTLTLRNANYWTFEGLNITGGGTTQGAPGRTLGALLEFVGGTGWIYRNSEVCCYGAYTLVSIGGEAKDFTFSHNLVWSNPGRNSQNDTDHNIYLQTSNNPANPGSGPSGPGFIERNILAGATNGANIKLGNASPETEKPQDEKILGPVNVVIRDNTLVAAHENIRFAFHAQSNLVENNLLVHATLLQNGGRWAVDPYCLLSGSNITRNNAWWGIDANSTTGPTGPNATAAGTGCSPLSASALSDGGGQINRNPGLNGGAGATAALARKTLETGNQLGELNPQHFQPTDSVARNYGRHSPFDQVVAGDWDGDGTDTPGGIIGNRIYLTNRATDPGSATLSAAAGEADRIFAFGSANGTDRYLAGDWNGDGTDEIGIYRPSDSKFYLQGGPAAFQFGSVSRSHLYQPIAGDWNGDGTDEIGFFDTETRRVILRNNDGSVVANPGYQFGSAARTYQAITGDWNNDDRDEIGLWDPEAHTFYIRACANDATSCSGPDQTAVAVPAPPTGAVYQPVAGNWTKDDGSGDPQGIDTPAYISWGVWNALKTNQPNTARYTPRPYDG